MIFAAARFKGATTMMTFDRPFARLLLEVCRYLYAVGFKDAVNDSAKKDALAWIRNFGHLTTDEPIAIAGSKTSVACVVAYPDRNIVAYMGTKTQFDSLPNAIASIEDWSKNLNTLLVPFRMEDEQLGPGHPGSTDKNNLGGRVHRGFLEELCAVQGEVVAELLKRGGRDRPVYITGHSQGGAEAAIATRALLAAGFPVTATYTFAAPRAGNKEFTASVPATLPVHRIEFGDDIVPHVPPMLVSKEAKELVTSLAGLPILSAQTKKWLDLVAQVNVTSSFCGLGSLAYGSHKTKAIRVGMSAQDEAAIFNDRLWSLARHPERWAEHHHLAGTKEEVSRGLKGNYTALISDFQMVIGT
jgi:hypothetical protein